MSAYRVRPGYTFGWRDDFKPGDVVTLTEAEAGGFLDKLELVEEPAAPEPPADTPEDGGEADHPAETPEDGGEADHPAETPEEEPAETGKKRKG